MGDKVMVKAFIVNSMALGENDINSYVKNIEPLSIIVFDCSNYQYQDIESGKSSKFNYITPGTHQSRRYSDSCILSGINPK